MIYRNPPVVVFKWFHSYITEKIAYLNLIHCQKYFYSQWECTMQFNSDNYILEFKCEALGTGVLQ